MEMVALWLPWRSSVTVTVVEGPQVGLRGSENRRSRVSPGSGLPSTPPPSLIETNTGPAASEGARGPKAAALVQPAKATVKLPTEVSWAPAPSVMASVAVGPGILTPGSAPPAGTMARLQAAELGGAAPPDEGTRTLSTALMRRLVAHTGARAD